MAYLYIRCLINRPIVCANLGDRGSSALLVLAKSSKHIVQILELLEERCLSYAFCINKSELLVLSGFGLLFETLNVGEDGKLLKDCRRMACAVVKSLERSQSKFAPEFRRAVVTLFSNDSRERLSPTFRHASDDEAQSSTTSFRATQQQLKAIASRFGPMCKITKDEPSKHSHNSAFGLFGNGLARNRNHSALSVSSIHSEPLGNSEMHSSDLLSSPIPYHAQILRRQVAGRRQQNLDYLPFSDDPSGTPTYQLPLVGYEEKSEAPVSPTDWERILSSLDNGQTNIYDSIYGGPNADALVDNSTSHFPSLQQTTSNSSDPGQHHHHNHHNSGKHNPGSSYAWLNEIWAMGLGGNSSSSSAGGSGGGGLAALHQHRNDSTSSRGSNAFASGAAPQPPQSVLSFSDESLTSGGEDFGISDFIGGGGDSHPGIVIPDMSPVVETLDDGVWAVD